MGKSLIETMDDEYKDKIVIVRQGSYLKQPSKKNVLESVLS